MLRGLVLDVDGVLTDGRVLYSAEGETLKSFHVHDGFGLKQVMKAGVKVAIISGRSSLPLQKRLTDLGIKSVYLDVSDKLPVLKDWLRSEHLDPEDVAYMGDDIPDLDAMRYVGCACAPANARPELLAMARIVTAARGGEGAVREVCDRLFGPVVQSVEANS